MSPEQHPLHWTDDAELLSAFVLGRIGEETREDLERHLAACARCASAVRTEQLLAAGAKRLGRETLRRVLNRRLPPPGKVVHWTPILSAAAILVVALGVAYLNRWIELPTGRVSPDDVITDTDAPPAGKPLAPPGAPPPARHPGEKATGTEEFRAGSGIPEKKDRQRNMEVDEQSVGESTGEAGKAEAPAPRLAEGTADREDGAGEWWSAKHVILGGPGDSLMQDVNPAAAQGKEMASRSAPQTAKRYLVRQERLDNSPDRQKLEARGAGGSGLKIRLDRSGTTTILTIFADPPFDPSVLSGATVEEIGPDSLVITIGGETFGASPVRPGNR